MHLDYPADLNGGSRAAMMRTNNAPPWVKPDA
jgi:hypothetical protein